MSKPRAKVIPEGQYQTYLRKAKEFYQTMYSAEKAENWNAVGLNGVHCVISLIDSLLARHSGLRSIDENHMAVIDLLTSSATSKLKDVREKSRLARRVIAQKKFGFLREPKLTEKRSAGDDQESRAVLPLGDRAILVLHVYM